MYIMIFSPLGPKQSIEYLKILRDLVKLQAHTEKVEKRPLQRKNRGHRMSKIVKSTQVRAMAICPIIVHFTT